MSSREAIVAEARAYLGTKFEHQGRMKGVGIDCAGLVIGVGRACGLLGEAYEVQGYARSPSRSLLESELDANFERLDPLEVRPGDILLFRIATDPQHLAIVSSVDPLMMVHALGGKGLSRCVEHGIDDAWRKRIVGAYRYRGLA